MKSSKIFLVGFALMAFAISAFAEERPMTEEVFNPHWYVRAQVGGQYTLGSIAFADLLSVNAQIGGGYQFNPVFGTRLSVDFWQSKAGSEINSRIYKWKWGYVAPAVDATFDLTNAIGGYKYDRLCSVGIFAGLGGNFRVGKSTVEEAYNSIEDAYRKYAIDYYRENGSDVSLLIRAGIDVDFRISDRVKLGIELSTNGVSDKYNYKRTGSPDYYFNALVGVKIALGKKGTHTTTVIPAPVPVERIVEKIVEVQVPCPETANAAAVAAESFRRDIFFAINSSSVDKQQMEKVKEVAEYLQKNTSAKVKISGYADAKTGPARFNDQVSRQRAKTVADILMTKYGIDESRIECNSYGSTAQPFADNNSNRVSICIAE